MHQPIETAALAESHRSAQFLGKDHGAQVSFFITSHERGSGPELHRHPYEETFIVEHGEAVFTIDDEVVHARGGQIIVVPAGAAHCFEGASDEPLRQVSIHPVPEMVTEWLT